MSVDTQKNNDGAIMINIRQKWLSTRSII